MTTCRHLNLVLLPGDKHKLRCKRCNLTISADELQGGYCPECFEVTGTKHCDFEEIESEDNEKARYRCEDCGAIIEAE